MRISLFLNSTMSKSCVRPQKNWAEQDKKTCVFSQDQRRAFSHQVSSSKQSSSVTPVSRLRQLPDLLSACYELQWLLSSRTSLSQTLDAAVKQIQSLSAVLLLYLTLLLLTAQVAGVAVLLSYAVSPPLGFQFMVAAVVFISVTAFKIISL
ncbi:uncharacterized protein LOC128990904 [Macrosteles quadrilineatus]|uniref:uncharacterized protein LOC128988615 n=1 Tax=Macrosteles quadrilineatus TaxID=74068 RepID=UPI0023E22205|nr:uncharacterized protein LOC128988615 [Macrosteles quadrilineatus]XP_054269530.1 uncharacterized protein LOC128990904 [Macrosteles quadrilineatus]